jgi:hypothetical protein
MLVVLELVALTEEELMQMVPLAGIITGCDVTQLLFAGCANVTECEAKKSIEKSQRLSSQIGQFGISACRNIGV